MAAAWAAAWAAWAAWTSKPGAYPEYENGGRKAAVFVYRAWDGDSRDHASRRRQRRVPQDEAKPLPIFILSGALFRASRRMIAAEFVGSLIASFEARLRRAPQDEAKPLPILILRSGPKGRVTKDGREIRPCVPRLFFR
jgi:hypothetical protein